jgi:glycosyltransferase involved in cell wall biosynthesis
MVIGYDARALSWSQSRGIATYMLGLLQQFARDPAHRLLLFSHRALVLPPALEAAVEAHAFPFRGDRFFGWEQLGLPAKAKASGADLMHSPNDTGPWWQPKPWVITIHDTCLLDSDEDENPQRLYYFRTWLPRIARRARFVLTVSDHSRRNLIERFRLPESRVVRVYHGRDEALDTPPPAQERDAFCREHGLSQPLVFSIGSDLPRKNSRLLLRVFHQLHQRTDGVCTVMAGVDDQFAAEAASLSPRTILMPFLSRDALRVLHHLATVFVSASLMEGFGFPCLDAITAGAPVVFSNDASFPEVVGDGGLAVDGRSEADVLRALERLLSDQTLRETCAVAARRQAGKFSWQKAARQTLEVYTRSLQS